MADSANTTSPPTARRWLVTGAVALAIVSVYLSTRSGSLGHRSVAEEDYELPIGQEIDRVRIEIQSGTVGVAAAPAPVVAVSAGVRRAADSAEDLATIEQLPIRLAAAPAPSPPGTLVLRGAALPATHTGVFAYDLTLRVPPSIAVEVAIAGSGHVTMADRTGRIDASTGRGDLRFERCHAVVHAKTGRGNVIAFDHRGDLRLLTDVGDMQAFVEQAGRELEMSTGQGTVQCVVPAGLEFDLDARAEMGRIGADFDLVAERVGEFGASLVGRRGNASTKVVLRTGKGHLAFRAR